MTGEAETSGAEAIGLHLTIGPPGADRFDHADGAAEAILRPDRLSVVTGGAGAIVSPEAPGKRHLISCVS